LNLSAAAKTLVGGRTALAYGAAALGALQASPAVKAALTGRTR
jgi:hypothetical protein